MFLVAPVRPRSPDHISEYLHNKLEALCLTVGSHILERSTSSDQSSFLDELVLLFYEADWTSMSCVAQTPYWFPRRKLLYCF